MRFNKQQFNIAAKMVDACGGNGRIVFGFGQNEGALDSCLRVEGQAFGSEAALDAALAHGFFDIGHEGRSVIADALVACLADCRVRVVDLLGHGSNQAGEVGQVTLDESFAQVDIGKNAVQGIGQLGQVVISSGGEEGGGAVAPIFGSGEGQVFFAPEVMEEAALGKGGLFADVLNAGFGKKCARVRNFLTAYLPVGIFHTNW